MKTLTERTDLLLDKARKKWLEQRALETNVSMADVIRQAIDQYKRVIDSKKEE